MTNEIKLFDITDTAIEELKNRYSGLTIAGIEDKEGYQAVRAARIVMKGYRVDVDKRRKELNEDALKHQRMINGEAKRIIERLAEVEDYLAAQQHKIDDEIEAIKHEELRQIELKKQARIDALVECGLRFNGNMFTGVNRTTLLPLVIVSEMKDDEFDALIAEEKAFKAQDDRRRAEVQEQLAIQAAAAKAQQEGIDAELAKERERLAAEKAKADAELAEQRAKLAAERAEAEAVRELLRAQEESLRLAIIAQEQKEQAPIRDEEKKPEPIVDRLDLLYGIHAGVTPEPEKADAIDLKPYTVRMDLRVINIIYEVSDEAALQKSKEHLHEELKIPYDLFYTDVVQSDKPE